MHNIKISLGPFLFNILIDKAISVIKCVNNVIFFLNFVTFIL